MDLTIVIPSFGLDAMLRVCLVHLEAGILRSGLVKFRVVVVDNGSVAPYQRESFKCQNLEILRLDRRSSFSRACNVGASICPSRFYLFLNNDVFLHLEAIHDMLQIAATPIVGICGARLVYPDDRIQHCGVRFYGSGGGPHHEYHGLPTQSVSRSLRMFQAVTGAVMLVRGEVFSALGGFDEAYPFGYEDVDLCLRARRYGATVTCSQAIDSIHFESFSDQNPARHSASRDVFYARWANRYAIDGDATR